MSRLKHNLTCSRLPALALRFFAVLVLIFALNWSVSRGIPNILESAGLQPQRWMTLDMTMRGAYRLSPQTQAVIRQLESPVALILIQSDFSHSAQEVAQFAQILANQSPEIQIETFSTSQTQAIHDLQARLHDRFANQLADVRQLLETTPATLVSIAQTLQDEANALNDAVTASQGNIPAGMEPLFTGTVRNLEQKAQLLQRKADELAAIRGTPMPAYQQQLESLSVALHQMDQELFEALPRMLTPLPDRRDLPVAVRGAVLSCIETLRQNRQQVRQLLKRVQSLRIPSSYTELREVMQAEQAMLAITDELVHAIPLDQIFQSVDAQDRTDTALMLGLIQEQLVGALARAINPESRLVVFVVPDQFEAVGQRGQMNELARRLQNLGFHPRVWKPMTQTPTGTQAMPTLQNAPNLPDSTRVVWMVYADPTLMQPQTADDAMPSLYQPATRNWLEQRFEQGDGLLIWTGYDPLATSQPPAPLLDWLNSQFGIEVQTDRILLREQPVSDRETRVSLQHILRRFEPPNKITAALDGIPLIHLRASPIQLHTDREDMPTQAQPLIYVQGSQLWAEDNIRELADVRYNPDKSQDQYITAATYEHDTGRLVVIADPMMALDMVTTNPDPQLNPQNMGHTAEQGAAYPGNAELIINSVAWLADMEYLIAPSLQSMQTPRIPSLTPQTIFILRLVLVGLVPLAILAAGVWVYILRRRD